MNQTLCWQAADFSPKQQEYFKQISEWWEKLDGRMVSWEFFDDSDQLSVAPLVTYQVQIEKPHFQENVLSWSKAGTTQKVCITIQRAIVDFRLQWLELIPEGSCPGSILACRYRVKVRSSP